MEDLANVYQFTCVKTICPNPADVSQTQQVKEVVYGRGSSMVDALHNFEDKMTVGKLSF